MGAWGRGAVRRAPVPGVAGSAHEAKAARRGIPNWRHASSRRPPRRVTQRAVQARVARSMSGQGARRGGEARSRSARRSALSRAAPPQVGCARRSAHIARVSGCGNCGRWRALRALRCCAPLQRGLHPRCVGLTPRAAQQPRRRTRPMGRRCRRSPMQPLVRARATPGAAVLNGAQAASKGALTRAAARRRGRGRRRS